MRNRIVATVRRRHTLSPRLRYRTLAAYPAACILLVGALLLLRHGHRRCRMTQHADDISFEVTRKSFWHAPAAGGLDQQQTVARRSAIATNP